MNRQEIYAMLCCYQAIRVLISGAGGEEGIDPRRGLLHRHTQRGTPANQRPGVLPPPELDKALTDLTFEITLRRNLVPERPGRRYARETKRPGGRYKTRKPGQSSRLTPLTVIKFWRMPESARSSLGWPRAPTRSTIWTCCGMAA
jgi:hypothetical protein